MLFIVIETFKDSDAKSAGARFRQKGRMLPEGVTYQASWMELGGARCFQLMDAADTALVERWTDAWKDLVDFEIIPVQTSSEFWPKAEGQ